MKFIDAVAGGDGPPDGRPTSASWSWARTSTASTAAPTAPPAACARPSRTGCSARRSARTPSAGLGGGIALDGRFRPVVEFMYADFMWVAADQLFNQIGKARHMFGGDDAVPLVLRSKVAMGTGYGSQHSMDPAGIFATSAGLAHRRAVDPVRLRRPDEHARCAARTRWSCSSTSTCTPRTGDGPVDDFDYCLPGRQGRGPPARVGDVTVLTYLAMTGYVLEAVERRPASTPR